MQKQPPLPFFLLRGHKGHISALHFTTELDHMSFQPVLISGSDIGEIFVWNLKTYRTEHRFSGHENKMIMFLHCYKSEIVSQGRDGVVNIWSYIQQQWTLIKRAPSNSTSVGFCSALLVPVEDTAHLMLLNEDKNLLYSHDITTGNQMKNLKFKADFGMCMCIKAFHMNGKMFLLAGFENGCIRMWDVEVEKELCHLKCHEEPVICMDFDSQYKNMGMSGSVDKYLETWWISEDLELVKVKTIEIINRGVNAVKIRDDGKIVITAGLDFNVRVFSWTNLRPLAVLKFHELAVYSLSYCPLSVDEHKSVFASGSKDQNIALWDIY